MKSYNHIILCVSIATFFSCKDTLDTHPMTSFDEETVWGSKSTADAFVYATYESVINGYFAGSGTCTIWESRSPNSIKCSLVGEGIDDVATELGIDAYSDWGPNRFSILRKCNQIIERSEASSAFTEEEKAELIAQGKFLRGLVFFDQARKMGRFVPLTQAASERLDVGMRIESTSPDSAKRVLWQSLLFSLRSPLTDRLCAWVVSNRERYSWSVLLPAGLIWLSGRRKGDNRNCTTRE